MIDKTEIFNLLKKFFQEVKNISLDAVTDKIEEYVYEQRKLAKEDQKEKDIVTAVDALCDAGITDVNTLRDLLYEHFRIDSRNDADHYIKTAKTVSLPMKKLIIFLKEEGYDHSSIRKFTEENHVREKLENNPHLSKLPINELKSFLESQ